jgi:hypothetical protein
MIWSHKMEAEKRVNLVFLDACRDNPLSRSPARSLGTRSSSVVVGLAPIQSAIGTMITHATQPDMTQTGDRGDRNPAPQQAPDLILANPLCCHSG